MMRGYRLMPARAQINSQLALNLDEAINEFLYDKEITNVAEGTKELYHYVFDSFTSFLDEDSLPVDQIDKSWIRQYLSDLKNQDYKPSTISIHYRNLNALFNWLVNEDYLDTNPMDNISETKTPDKYPRVISEEQVKKLLKAERKRRHRWAGQRNYTMLLLFIDTGLRLNELVTAKLDKLDLPEHVLTVFGKGSKERVVSFGTKVSKALRRWLDKRNDLEAIYDDEYLFVDNKGEKLKKRNVQQIITRIQKRAGLEDQTISPHVLRHTSATLAARNGMSVFQLTQMYGWSKLETAQKYIHMSGRDVKL